MRLHVILIAAVLVVGTAVADAADLAFKPVRNPPYGGLFAFDTGVVKGELRADDASQGFHRFVDVKSGTALAYGHDNPGILSYYRLLSAGERWGEDFRAWPKSAKILPDGAVQIHWLPRDDHPVELTATYRWRLPDTLDLETIIRPEPDVARVEVFLSSYFDKDFRSRVYVQAPRHAPGKPHFMPLDANPMIVGTYLAFPRDLRAAQLVYDGRWERGRHPVQFSVTRFLAAPLALKRNIKNGVTVVVMARPEDCFAIEAPYDKEPPDGVAGHCSLYLSLFGQDLKAGQTARAHTRLVVGQDIAEQGALDLYQKFLEEMEQRRNKGGGGRY